MRIIDLTHTIAEDMPVYPGMEQPGLKPAASYEKDGYLETQLKLFSHTGTHMDAPAHIFPGRTTLDEFPATQFVGPALVIDCTALPKDALITMEQLAPVQKKADAAEFLLFHTGWDAHWGTRQYYEAYPHITQEVARYITANHKKGIGVDVMSVDPVFGTDIPIHKQLLREHEIVILENLTNLGMAGCELFTLYALPLKFRCSDGAPVRAIAICNDDCNQHLRD